MQKYLIGLFAVCLVGCAEAPPHNEKPTEYPPAQVVAPAALSDHANDSSEVLNKNKKCPRKSKMVNGKCTLQVETTE